ncbi:MAG: CvpA family protein [Defluviitaleaceae bacterium]|nr:CvpA family protein [Defluviitaleaceae bacterium]
MNTLDFIMIGILALCAFIGFRKGLVRTLYRFVSFALAIFLATRLQPVVARWLRDSFIYVNIRERIAGATNMEGVFREYAPSPGISDVMRSSNMINALPVPQSMRESIYNANTPDMFELLRVSTIEDFIAGFFANIVINVISLLVVFILVLLILHFVGKALKIVDMIPVVNSFNRGGGLIAGVLIGAGVVWIGLFIVIMFFSSGINETFYGLLQGSVLTRWLINNGWLYGRFTAV